MYSGVRDLPSMDNNFPTPRDLRDGSMVFKLNDNGMGPELLRQVFIERGWVEFDEEEQNEDDWNLYWRTSRFRASDYDLIRPWQRLNHFPKSVSITKKDSLARNLKRMKGIYGNGVYNFFPTSFNLPNDYTKFVSEYSRLRQTDDPKYILWIFKPADQSRGRGIFIFRELSDLQYDCCAVVQRYIANPLLIGGYKFDLRIYVLVPSFQPLVVYVYQEGLVRFSTEKFNLDSLNNIFSHLTNTSINKYSSQYTADKERVGPGCKWTLTQLRYYFHQSNIDDRMLFARIANIIILTLLMQTPQCPKTNSCFELYGFDVLIDENLKPWLLEVNFSPALTLDCQTDSLVKKPLIHDLLDMMKFKESDRHRGRSVAVPGNVDSKSPRSKGLLHRRQSLVSRQRDASMKHFNRLHSSQFGGGASSYNPNNESSYCYEDNEDQSWARSKEETSTGGGLPIVKDRADIKRQDSDSSGFSSSSSSAGDGHKRPKSSLGFDRNKGRCKEVLENNTGKTDSRLCVNSDSAVSSGSERCASMTSNTSDQRTATKTETETKPSALLQANSFRTTKPRAAPVHRLKTSASSPALHKISSHWSTSQQNLSELKFANRDKFVPNRSGTSSSGSGPAAGFRSYRQAKPQSVPPLLRRSTLKPVLSSVPKDSFYSNNNSLKNPLTNSISSQTGSKTSVQVTKSQPKSGLPAQVGDYFLVFPTSDGMIKASKPILEVRTAIQESQKQLKRSLVEIRSGGTQTCKPVPHGIVPSSDHLWGPIRLPDKEN